MLKRTKIGQAKHDKAVLSSALNYESRGFQVKADLPGYKKPKKIGGYVPDIIAKKGKIEKIIEIETKKSNKVDVDQQKAFKKYADKKSNRDFRKRIV